MKPFPLRDRLVKRGYIPEYDKSTLTWMYNNPEAGAELLRFDNSQGRRDYIYEGRTGGTLGNVDMAIDGHEQQWELLDGLNLPNTVDGVRLRVVASMLIDKYTQQEIGDRLGVSQPYVSKLVSRLGDRLI